MLYEPPLQAQLSSPYRSVNAQALTTLLLHFASPTNSLAFSGQEAAPPTAFVSPLKEGLAAEF